MLLDALNPLGGSRTLSYDWRTKDEPLLWLADTVCGAVADFLLTAEGKMHCYAELQTSAVLEAPTYINEKGP